MKFSLPEDSICPLCDLPLVKGVKIHEDYSEYSLEISCPTRAEHSLIPLSDLRCHFYSDSNEPQEKEDPFGFEVFIVENVIYHMNLDKEYCSSTEEDFEDIRIPIDFSKSRKENIKSFLVRYKKFQVFI